MDFYLFCTEREIRLIRVLQLDGAQALGHAHVTLQIFIDLLKLLSRDICAETRSRNFRIRLR